MLAPSVRPIEAAPRGHLGRLFDEEASLWAHELLWSFEPTRKRLEAALDEGSLTGFVASDDQGACGYATFSTDGEHGIVGSFFTSSRARAREIETVLVNRVLEALLSRRLRVIDCQTLFSSDPGLIAPFAAKGFSSATRLYMSLDRKAWLSRRAPGDPGSESLPVQRPDLRSVSGLVYEAHLDNRSLDASSSFDTQEACDRILQQVVLDEVCGPFDSSGSRRVEAQGRTVAASLLTWPLPKIAHVSEVATAPAFRRRGLARRCLTETLSRAFEQSEAVAATLSVTASNAAAIALYESMGFLPRVRYESHVRRELPH